MVLRVLAVAVSFAVLSSCAAGRAAVPARAPTEHRFARGLLKASSPGPEWKAQTDALVVGTAGARAKFPLLYTKGGSMIGVIVYPTSEGSPVMIADKMAVGLRDLGSEAGEVECSVQDDRRAWFRYRELHDGKEVGRGKMVTIRLDENVSAAVIGTWQEADASDEAAMDAVAGSVRLGWQ